ncbi:MAG TPA: NADH-quinone oxidoreductase subunit K [Anaerolineaceae bacterium]|jgi:NADH:ubiquinone oxidoreductase subunit K|nr:NADH-quinone oxidoreductase subunit K [Longilinea sp.]HNR46490.1 NADH-quinone oxidoreductase subunit K [Anaerolineaceae bacterium]HNZ13085.1 NADH-quinone oxidoreductase subunit K [Anaerolineaceae bacterium]HOG79286.1 NADH-quinone oxidoreductase subunit K [Anaerolineaceae bacterium]
MSNYIPHIILGVAILLLGVGIYALLATRNLIKVIVALQIMVKGAMLVLVLAGKMTAQPGLGQTLALTVIVADTIVAVIGLTLAVQIRRRFGSLDVKDLTRLKR